MPPMTEKTFRAKWDRPEFGPNWSDTCDHIFWAASYKMDIMTLIAMSTDYLKLRFVLKDTTENSSQDLAHRTLMSHNRLYREYGIAGLL